MDRRTFIIKSAAGAAALAHGLESSQLERRSVCASIRGPLDGSVVLHNGIVLEDPFPPMLDQFLDGSSPPDYLLNPPSTIPINVGRQLFVDDFLIDSLNGLTRSLHSPVIDRDPLIAPEENESSIFHRSDGLEVVSYFAAPYSDGVWWDAYRRRFRAWLLSGRNALGLAESDDGIAWHRVRVANGSETIMDVPHERDSGTVWIDFETDDESARYKMSHFSFSDKKNWLYESSDGVVWPPHWGPDARTVHYASNPNAPFGDRTTFFRDPFRKKWIWSLRDILDLREMGGRRFNRVRRYAEADELIGDPSAPARNTRWMVARPDDTVKGPPQLYNVDGIAYESLMLFMLTIWTDFEFLDRKSQIAAPKSNSIHLGFSRDGFHVMRPDASGRPFIGPGDPESWREGNVQSVGGGITFIGPPDREVLYIYFTARENRLIGNNRLERFGRMGLARLRRDGFASIGSDGEGSLTTRIIRFDHDDGYLFVNVDSDMGEMRVEILDEDGFPLPGFSASECIPLSLDSTRVLVEWYSNRSLRRIRGERFRIRFHIRSSRLYSFWVSPNPGGLSNGYTAAGGPAYSNYRDEGIHSPTSVNLDEAGTTPSQLLSNSPNPFSGVTRIRYRLNSPQEIDLAVYDLLGRLVVTLVRGRQPAGSNEVEFDGTDLAPGVYLCRLSNGTSEVSMSITKARLPLSQE